MVVRFENFIEEGYNLNTDELGDITFEDRWFYYNSDDEIIYGCDNEPVNETYLFYFNPKSCEVVMNGKKIQYDINNPVCLIYYKIKTDEVRIYTNDTMKFLNKLGYSNFNNDIESMTNKHKIQEIFDNLEDLKLLLIKGNKLISSTFDIIDEN